MRPLALALLVACGHTREEPAPTPAPAPRVEPSTPDASPPSRTVLSAATVQLLAGVGRPIEIRLEASTTTIAQLEPVVPVLRDFVEAYRRDGVTVVVEDADKADPAALADDDFLGSLQSHHGRAKNAVDWALGDEDLVVIAQSARQ